MTSTRTGRRAAGVARFAALSVVAAACGTASAERVAVPIDEPNPSHTVPVEPAPLTPASTVAESVPPVSDPVTPTTEPLIVPHSTTTAPPVDPTPPEPTLPRPAFPPRAPVDPFFGATATAFDRLARGNAGASLTVVSGGNIVFSNAAGTTIDGGAATGDSPMVVASVSKIIVAIGIARLHAAGTLDVAAPFPWADVGLAPNPAWNDVTIRELLDHRSGLSKARSSWFTGEGTCRDYVPSLLTSVPNGHRGSWVYSNGNYCLLGMLIEQRTGLALDEALQQIAFAPVGADGVHLTDDGHLPGDIAYPLGLARLSRLGGAGTLIVSTDDIASVVGRMTVEDLAVLQPPGVFTDQYGFGHTGTIDEAKACVWVFDGGTTVVSVTITGESVSTGGRLCDVVVPAVAADLGIYQGVPDRTP